MVKSASQSLAPLRGTGTTLSRLRVDSLKDESGAEIGDFETLVDDAKYTLGPPGPLQQQQQMGTVPARPEHIVQ